MTWRRAGDLILEDRGFLDGESITHLKRERKVDVIVPLKSNMHAYSEAVSIAEMSGRRDQHPSRTEQQIAFVAGVEHVWDECLVPRWCVRHPVLQHKEAPHRLHCASGD